MRTTQPTQLHCTAVPSFVGARSQERLGPGRIFHCMRWLGQAQRAFDLMCQRLNSRKVRGEPLGRKQLMQKHVFDSYAEIQVRAGGVNRPWHTVDSDVSVHTC